MINVCTYNAKKIFLESMTAFVNLSDIHSNVTVFVVVVVVVADVVSAPVADVGVVIVQSCLFQC